MGAIGTALIASATSSTNQQSMAELVANLCEKARKTAFEVPEQLKKQFLAQGRLLPRERVERLLDPGTAFLEIGQLAGHVGNLAPTGLIAGIGEVSGHLAMIIADDLFAENGDTIATAKRLRAQQIAAENRLPTIYLADKASGKPSSRALSNQASLSANGVPQIVASFDASSAGAIYMLSLADRSIVASTQNDAVSMADHLAQSDAHALHLARQAMATLSGRPAPRLQGMPPQFDPEEMNSFAPADVHQRPEVAQIIARIVDSSRFESFRPHYGPALVCGFATVEKMPVGIIAYQDVISPEAAEKAARFIALCNQQQTPLLFLEKLSEPASNAEHSAEHSAEHRADIARQGARMLAAIATASVPKISLVIGGTLGGDDEASRLLSSSRHAPRFIWAWPNVGAGSEDDAPGQLWHDGIIAPPDSRAVIALSLRIACHTTFAGSEISPNG